MTSPTDTAPTTDEKKFPDRDPNKPVLMTDLEDGELEAILAKYQKNIRPCGDCTLCCKVMAVPEINKPWDKWCQHCNPKTGCKIYPTRPHECKAFYCLWALGVVPEWIKPNKTHVVIASTLEGKHLVVHHDPQFPEAQSIPKLREFYRSAIRKGFKVIARKEYMGKMEYFEFDHERDVWILLIRKTDEETGVSKVFSVQT